MTEKLIKYIKQSGLNYKQFAMKADIPYTTLMSVLKRGVENSTISSIIKMCDALGIEVEDLKDSAPMPEEKTSITMIARGSGKKEFKLPNEKAKAFEMLLEQFNEEEKK